MLTFNKSHIITNPAGGFSIKGSAPAHPRCLRFFRLAAAGNGNVDLMKSEA